MSLNDFKIDRKIKNPIKINKIRYEEEYDESDDVEPEPIKKVNIIAKKKAIKAPEYDMGLNQSHLDSQTKYTNEVIIGIFKEVFNTNLSDKKIAKVLKSDFKVSMTHIDYKKI
jgi:hypothetical protein